MFMRKVHDEHSEEGEKEVKARRMKTDVMPSKEEVDEHNVEHIRLIVRARGDYWKKSWFASVANYVFGEPAHFIMERRMLLGIKQRVESECE